jgi:molecular chaperone DnaJ
MPNGTKASEDWYSVLGVAADADAQALKRAYRQKVRDFHPDGIQDPQEAAERSECLKAINAAYRILGDPEHRKAYDVKRTQTAPPAKATSAESPASGTAKTQEASGKASAKPSSGPPKQAAAPGKGSQTSSSSSESKTDSQGASWWQVWRRSTDKVSEAPPPSAASPKEKPSSPPPETATSQVKEPSPNTPSASAASSSEVLSPKGAAPSKPKPSVQVSVLLSPLEALKGCSKPLAFEWQGVCPQCHGGKRVQGKVCSTCEGTGSITRTEKRQVALPKGLKAGSKIRIAAHTLGPTVAASLDSVWVIPVLATDERLKLDGLDVRLDWAISLPIAVLGGVVTIPTLYGTAELTIPAGCGHGKVLRMEGQGLKQGERLGHQWVKLELSVPGKLNPEQRALYLRLLELDAKP